MPCRMIRDHTTGSGFTPGKSAKQILHSGHSVFDGFGQGTSHGFVTRGGTKVWTNPSAEATCRRPEEHISDLHFWQRGFFHSVGVGQAFPFFTFFLCFCAGGSSEGELRGMPELPMPASMTEKHHGRDRDNNSNDHKTWPRLCPEKRTDERTQGAASKWKGQHDRECVAATRDFDGVAMYRHSAVFICQTNSSSISGLLCASRSEPFNLSMSWIIMVGLCVRFNPRQCGRRHTIQDHHISTVGVSPDSRAATNKVDQLRGHTKGFSPVSDDGGFSYGVRVGDPALLSDLRTCGEKRGYPHESLGGLQEGRGKSGVNKTLPHPRSQGMAESSMSQTTAAMYANSQISEW